VPGHGGSTAGHASGNIVVTSPLLVLVLVLVLLMLLVYWGPVMGAIRWKEGGNSGLDLCLLGQEDL
jgi:hypothetical protein